LQLIWSTKKDDKSCKRPTFGVFFFSVISAIVQRYLPQVTTLAQSTKPHIQKTAVDIISFTIKQGLTHPLECVPVLVALESSKDAAITSQVFALHTLLHVQRGNLVHCRFLETMNKVFDCHNNASGTSLLAKGMLPATYHFRRLKLTS